MELKGRRLCRCEFEALFDPVEAAMNANEARFNGRGADLQIAHIIDDAVQLQQLVTRVDDLVEAGAEHVRISFRNPLLRSHPAPPLRLHPSGNHVPIPEESPKYAKISLQGSAVQNPKSCKRDYLPKRAKPDAEPLSEFFTDD
jgi:hypothetical protein